MSQKAHRGSHPEEQPAGQAEPSFASLPDAVLAHIAHLSKSTASYHRGHALLRISMSCRDAVLSSLTAVKLRTTRVLPPASEAFSREACARLLHRACCQARPGLQLKLDLEGDPDSLPHLLQPGVDCGGWRNVHKLEVFNAPGLQIYYSDHSGSLAQPGIEHGGWRTVRKLEVARSAHLLCKAFPALTELQLHGQDLDDGHLFSLLAAQAPCLLTSITLHSCNINGTAVDAAAAAFARLPSLKACHVSGEDVLLQITSQLTKLTSLKGGLEAGVPPPDTQLVKAVKRNQGLQSLSVNFAGPASAELLQCLLMSGTSLTQLDLPWKSTDDQGLDMLLKHGASITDLTLGKLDLTRSRADSPCRWQRLELMHTDSVLKGLAYLPLKSVQELKTAQEVRMSVTYDPETLDLRLIHREQTDLLLKQATSNLAACPAWQKQPATRILLYTPPEYRTIIPDTPAAQLISALSPVAGPHLHHLAISLNVELGQQEVQALARSLGSSLKSLSLRRGFIKPSFWPALSQHLPHLKELGLMHKVQGSIMGITAYLRTLAQPFTLYIARWVLAGHMAADLTSSIDAWQMQGVSVKQEYAGDREDFGNMDGQEEEWDLSEGY